MKCSEKQKDWQLEFGFHGFELDDEHCDLGSGLVVTRVKFPLEETDPISAFIIKMSFFFKVFPTVFLKIQMRNKTENALNSEIFVLGRLFLLLGRGSVQTTSYYRILPEGETKWREITTSSSFHTMPASYRINSDKIPQIKWMIGACQVTPSFTKLGDTNFYELFLKKSSCVFMFALKNIYLSIAPVGLKKSLFKSNPASFLASFYRCIFHLPGCSRVLSEVF